MQTCYKILILGLMVLLGSGCDHIRTAASNVYTGVFPGSPQKVIDIPIEGDIFPRNPSVGSNLKIKLTGLTPDYSILLFLYKGEVFGDDFEEMGPVFSLGHLNVDSKEQPAAELEFVLSSRLGNDQFGKPFTIEPGEKIYVGWEAYSRERQKLARRLVGRLQSDRFITVQ